MTDTVAVVSGGGGGIGGACARALAAAYDVVVCVDRDLGKAEATAGSLDGGLALRADAADPEFGEQVVRYAGQHGKVGCAVHAVADEKHVPALELSRDAVLKSLTIGPVAAFSLFRACAVDPAPGASYVAIGSLHERYAFRNCLGYNAAHGALGQVVRTLAHEWAERRIRVNAVVPGWMATPGEEVLHGPERLAEAGARLPFGALGRPEQVAAAVAFLASDAADYVSGSFLTVDGALEVSLARLQGVD